jgi:hypothetical protein
MFDAPQALRPSFYSKIDRLAHARPSEDLTGIVSGRQPPRVTEK